MAFVPPCTRPPLWRRQGWNPSIVPSKSSLGRTTQCVLSPLKRGSTFASADFKVETKRSICLENTQAFPTSRYRLARPEDAPHLMDFYEEDGLLDIPKEKVEAWIKARQVFIAVDPSGSYKPAGMIRTFFADSVRKGGNALAEQFSLTTPVRIVKAGHYSPFTKQIVDDFEIGAEGLLGIDNLALFYCNSFAVQQSERGKLTAVNLFRYSIAQYRSIFESCRAREQFCPDAGNGAAARGKLGLLFGSSRDDDTVRRLALHVWQKMVESIWGDSKTVLCVVFEQDRPDGVKGYGNLLTIETALP